MATIMAIYGAAWFPFFGLIAFYVPQFEYTLACLQRKGELPLVTGFLLWFSWFNWTTLWFPCLLGFALLLLLDRGVAYCLRNSQPRHLFYALWITTIVFVGICAAFVVPLGMYLPVLK